MPSISVLNNFVMSSLTLSKN